MVLRGCRHIVIASQRVGARRRPMTGSAKQSTPSFAKQKWIASSRPVIGAHSPTVAPLRKRFAFVAGNDGNNRLISRWTACGEPVDN